MHSAKFSKPRSFSFSFSDFRTETGSPSPASAQRTLSGHADLSGSLSFSLSFLCLFSLLKIQLDSHFLVQESKARFSLVGGKGTGW